MKARINQWMAVAFKGFVVVIDANNTKYAITFDAAGNFVASKAIH